MSDFTHTLKVTVSLDDGRTIQATNSYVIPGVLFVAQQSGILGGISNANTPPIENPDFVILEGSGGANQVSLENGASDSFVTLLFQGDICIVHGPAFFEQDTNAGASTNAGTFASIAFAYGGPGDGFPSYMALNNTAS